MSVSKTVKASGGDYTTLAGWEDGMDGNLTGTGYSEAICYAIDDVSAVSLNGWTTTSSDYITISCDSTARHSGVWNGDKYNLIVTDAAALSISEDYVRLDGLQIAVTGSTATRNVVAISDLASGANEVWISNCIIKGNGDSSYADVGIQEATSENVKKIWNTIVYNISTNTNSRCVLCDGTSTALYSNTLIGGRYGVRVILGTVTAKNTYAGGSATEDWYRSGGTLNKTNCASEDQSADDTSGADETATNCVAAAVLIDADTFVNVGAGTEDFHLAADGASPLMGAGTSTTGDSSPLNFTTNIDGETRDATWDIGADSWVVSSVSSSNRVLCIV